MSTRYVVAALALIGAAAFIGINPGTAVADAAPDSCVVTASYTPNAHEYEVADDTGYPAQVITAEIGITHPFVTLELSECRQNGAVDAQLQIVTAPGGVPDLGNVLGTVVVSSSAIVDTCVGGVFGDVVFEFPSVELAAGTQYALVLQALNGNGGIEWRRSSTPQDPSNPYPGGNLWNYDMGMPMENSNLDLQFEVCGTLANCTVTASYTPNAHEYEVADDTGYPAQVITAEIGITHPFVTLELSECRQNGAVDAQLQIVTAPGGVPDLGNVLGTVVVSSSAIVDTCVGGVFGDVVFEFPSVELTAGTQYALVLQALNGNGGIEWRRSSTPQDPSNPYPGGNLWNYDMGMPMENSNLDLQFAVCGTVNTSGISAPGAPVRSALLYAAPNPFRPSTVVSFAIAAPGSVRLTVYDVAGRRVRTLVNETRPAGTYQVAWDGRDDSGRSVASGTYILSLSARNTDTTRRVTILR